MAVEGSDVMPAEFLEHRPGCHHALHVLFGFFGEVPRPSHVPQNFFGAFPEGGVGLTRPDFGKVSGESPGVVSDGHLVIVKDHQHIGALMARVGQRFESHAAGDGAVTNNGHYLSINALLLRRHGHAHRGGDAGGGVTYAKGIEGAL